MIFMLENVTFCLGNHGAAALLMFAMVKKGYDGKPRFSTIQVYFLNRYFKSKFFGNPLQSLGDGRDKVQVRRRARWMCW
jgi:hypothetical protein